MKRNITQAAYIMNKLLLMISGGGIFFSLQGCLSFRVLVPDLKY